MVQGSCASVMKRALVDLDAAGLGDYLTLSIHDEVMLDVPEAQVDEVIEMLPGIMRRDEFSVPLTVSTKTVSRWGDPYREESERY